VLHSIISPEKTLAVEIEEIHLALISFTFWITWDYTSAKGKHLIYVIN